MVKGKIAGFAFGGLAGYLLISKGINLIRDCVAYGTDAAKWRAYYKFGVQNDRDDNDIRCVVPPGYSSASRSVGGGKEIVIEDPKQKKDENSENKDASTSDLKSSLADAVNKAIKELLDKPKAQEEAKEGDSEASDKDVFGDTVTTRDENGKPIAGRYPCGDTDGDDILCPEQFDKAPVDAEPLYHDDLENGVDATYENVEDIFEDFDKEPVSDKYSYTDDKKTEEKETDDDETVG